MLQHIGIYNDLSKSLIEKLEKRIEGFGKIVRYRFDIERENPDKTFHDGKVIFPNMYTLDPTIFKISDKDDATGKTKTKNIALIKEYKYDERNNLEFIYRKIRVHGGQRGMLRLDLENSEDVETCMYLELHPKLSGGDFSDKDKVPVFKRIDENAEAAGKTEDRNIRRKAMNIAGDMTPQQLVDFSCAMQWDSSLDTLVLKNMVEELAETDSKFFADLVEGKEIEYRATIQKAINNGVIRFEPADYKYIWVGNNMTITVLSPVGDKSELEKFSEFLQHGNEEVYKKLKSLVNNKKELVA